MKKRRTFMDEERLDERQEQTLLKMESKAFWMMYVLLAASVVIQRVLFPSKMELAAGEGVILLLMSVYAVGTSLYHGIWDRKIAPTRRNHTIISTAAALISALCVGIVHQRAYHSWRGTLLSVLISAAITFVLCLFILSALAKIFYKRTDAMENADRFDRD